MKIVLLSFAILLCCEFSNAQVVTTAVPFLQFIPSPEANGIGGITSSLNTNDPFAIIVNPGQLGMRSLSQYFGAGAFVPKTPWIPILGNTDLTYTADVAFAGLRVDDYLGVPFGLSVGFGYSFVQFDLGEFAFATGDPTVIQKVRATESANAYTFGVGVDCGIRLGLGATIRRVTSRMPGLLSAYIPALVTAKGTAYDYGALATVPIARLVPGATTLIPDFEPILDLNIGAGRSNIGKEIYYIDPLQADPLPRTAFVGVGLEAAVVSHRIENDWKLVSLSLARQGECLLVRTNFDAPPDYLSGFGPINFLQNVVGGKRTGRVGVRKGFQADILELFSYRTGSFDLPAYGLVGTSGYGIHLRGILNAIEAVGVSFPDDGIAGYILHHIDVSYDHSEYSARGSGLDQTKFGGLSLVVR